MTQYNSNFAVKNQKILRLDDWFPDRRYLPLLSVQKCNLIYNQRRVYSYLVFRRRNGQTATHHQITEILAMSHHTTAQCVSSLVDVGLATITPEGVMALAPSQSQMAWFVPVESKKKDPQWFDVMGTYREFFRCKNSPISVICNGVLCWLNAFARENSADPRKDYQTVSGIADQLRCSTKQVRRAVVWLADQDLVETYGDYGYILSRPSSEQLDWWLSTTQKESPKPKPERKSNDTGDVYMVAEDCGWATCEDVAVINREIAKWSHIMAEAGYPRPKVIQFWTDEVVAKLDAEIRAEAMNWMFCYSSSFNDLFAEVESQHGKTGKSPYSLFLLKAKTPALLTIAQREARLW